MLIKQVVINASPLIVLFKSQQADLLPQLFDKIFVPKAVWDEVTVNQSDAPATQLQTVTWLQRIDNQNVASEVAAWDLGKGESAVLSLALNISNCAVIIDDRAARRCAQSFNIITLGTGRLLLLAKQRGLIPLVSPRIQALRDAGLWLSDSLVHLLKEQAGE